MTKAEFLYDLIRTGIGDKEEQTKAFIEKFDKSVCSFLSEFNKTLLQTALSSRKYKIAKFLIEQKCNLDHQDERGNTALIYLLGGYNNDNKELYSELIRLMIDKGAKLDPIDVYGNQVLWVGLLNAKVPLEILELLLKNGADMHHKNNVNKSPYDAVQEYNLEDLSELFQKYL